MPEPNPEKAVFEQALELESAKARTEFVRQACGGDHALIARVRALLQVAESASGFLPGEPGSVPAACAVPGFEEAGSTIGHYKLLESIGEGGFGVVYLAEQFDPIRRRVALKVLKPGMDSKQVIGRFEVERQALALMDHPNIARVFDAGTTVTGRPYFVMELVRGIPITGFCDERHLDLEGRLNLFIEVCAAVQHAHQKGIIHRDLKPSNILVTVHGDKPVPKIIDFGIAKATEQKLTDKTVFTQFQQFIGTPAYMSPEQAALSRLDVDTRSDIYSLGVLLYVLLTGSLPFDTEELLSAGLDEMRRIIREKDPVRPSTRMTQQRRVSPPQLAYRKSHIASDLDWIVLKALAKDPDQRYATVDGLAEDLRRHLNHEPVAAVAPTLAYQVSKFYRRHRRAVALGVACGALLLGATAFSTWHSIRAGRAEAWAQSEAETAHNVAEFFWKDLIKQLSPWAQTNREVRLRDALDVAAGRIEHRLANQPLAEASVRVAFGKAYMSLSKLAEAEGHLIRALDLRRAHLGDADPRTAEALFLLADLRNFEGDLEAAGDFFDQAATIHAYAQGPNHSEALTANARALFARYPSLPPGEARQKLESLLETLRAHEGPQSDIARIAMNHLGIAYRQLEEYDRALELFAATERLATERDSPDGASALWSRTLTATALARQGQMWDAEALFGRILATQDLVNGPEHILTRDTRLAFVGEVLLPGQRFDEAAQILLDLARIEQRPQVPPRPGLPPVWQALETAWEKAGGGPGLDTLRSHDARMVPLSGRRTANSQ